MLISVMGNMRVFFVSKNEVEDWGTNTKEMIAQKLTDKISEYFFV